MARASKGKVKHLWDLYGVWHYVALHKAMVWFFEPNPEMKAITEAWLVKNMYPVADPEPPFSLTKLSGSV